MLPFQSNSLPQEGGFHELHGRADSSLRLLWGSEGRIHFRHVHGFQLSCKENVVKFKPVKQATLHNGLEIKV